MKRNLPTNDTSGSQSIASRVKGLRRPAKKKQKQPLDSPGSTQYINNSSTLFYCMQFCLGNIIVLITSGNYTYIIYIYSEYNI